MFLLIDNYDSFTFNLVQTFAIHARDEVMRRPEVRKNNDASILQLAQSGELSAVCISPGPGHPSGAGLCVEFLSRLPHSVPVLGVCLGHQILGHMAGCRVDVAGRIMHGKTSHVAHDTTGLFHGLPERMEVCRYHSLLVDASDIEKTPNLRTTAWVEPQAEGGGASDWGTEVMGLAYTDRPWVGVQFHPESILSPEGPLLLANFPHSLAKASTT